MTAYFMQDVIFFMRFYVSVYYPIYRYDVNFFFFFMFNLKKECVFFHITIFDLDPI